MATGISIQTFKCERLGPRRYKSEWSQGATMFHRTFKDAKARHDLIAETIQRRNGHEVLVATFTGCPLIAPEVA